MIKFFGACKFCRFNYAALERLPSHELLDFGKRISRALLCLDQRLTDKRVESHLVIDCFALLLETGEVFMLGLIKKLAEEAFVHLQRLVDEYRGGSVATLQVARDRLAGCSSWPLRFAVYSSGGNLSRRSSCWQWGGTCAFPFRTATSRSCSPSGACAPITSPSGGGSSAMARKWNNVCVGDSNQPTTVGG